MKRCAATQQINVHQLDLFLEEISPWLLARALAFGTISRFAGFASGHPMKEQSMSTQIPTESSDHTFEAIRDVQTSIVDAINGYQRMLEKAEPSFRGTVSNLIELHKSHESGLQNLLNKAGETSPNEGSFMSNVHETVVTVRSWFDDIDGDLTPQIIQGEERILEQYDRAINETYSRDVLDLLRHQQTALASLIQNLRASSALL
jgi:hypothetical protein